MDPVTKDYVDTRDELTESPVNADIVRIYATMDSMRTTIEAQGKASEMLLKKTSQERQPGAR